ncbi:hypothetical protein AMTRI_Chr13g116410 [Amborella trichopoda]
MPSSLLIVFLILRPIFIISHSLYQNMPQKNHPHGLCFPLLRSIQPHLPHSLSL